MSSIRWPRFVPAILLLACQANSPSYITIIDDGRPLTIETKERIPLAILTQAGIVPQAYDKVLFNGNPHPIELALPESEYIQLQHLKALPVTINSPQGQQLLQTAALTVGQALGETGIEIRAGDLINPPLETSITAPMTVTFSPAKDMTIFVDDEILQIRSSAGTVGKVLTEAGIPLIGLDFSSPLENEAPPPDGQIRVVRVHESVSMEMEPIPFTTQVIESAEIPLGQDQTIQPGVNGLSMVRTRIRYEDGKEVSRAVDGSTVVREPQQRIVAGGSQVVLAPLPTGGIPYQYWLATEMYATVYSPCQSGTGGCSYNTASGAPAGKGIVAVDYSIYNYLAGMQVYIPGYGLAIIGDTGGGPIIESALGVPRTKWIDLGFDEGGIVDMTGWVTVYFLAPAPAEIPYFLK